MYIIGGWLGSGTYAANDMYVLNLGMIRNHFKKLHYIKTLLNGT